MSNDSMTSALQNAVIAINKRTSTDLYLSGQFTSDTYTGATTVVIATTKGQLINVCINTSAAATVTFYNQSSSATLFPSKVLCKIAASANLGVYPIGQVFDTGLVMVVGAGVSANVTYSLG